MIHINAAYQAAYGLSLLAYGSFDRSKPCATKPAWNRIYVTLIPNQVINPATDVILTNHPKTVPDPLLTLIYERNENAVQNKMESSGRPLFVVLVKILGALPERAKP